MANPETTYLVVVEDDPGLCLLLRANFRPPEYEITAEAHTLQEAHEVILKVENHEIECTAMIIDGRLDPSHEPAADALKVLEDMRIHHLACKAIGFSLDDLESFGAKLDYQAMGKSLSELRAIVQEIHDSGITIEAPSTNSLLDEGGEDILQTSTP